MAETPIPMQRRSSPASADELQALCHDLRQYLSACALLAALPEDAVVDVNTGHRLRLIERTLAQASTLLDTVARGLPSSRRTMNLADVAGECVSVAEPAYRIRFVSATWDTPLVDGDPQLVRRAVSNLIDNAGRAVSADGGDVIVRVGGDRRDAWVEVLDDGPGFGAIAHGTGQGLSVVSQTAREHGGRLEIHSGPGPGTRVRLALPRVGTPVGAGRSHGGQGMERRVPSER